MDPLLRTLMRQFAGVVLASLLPVVLTAFLCIPFILGGHPGDERLVDAGTFQHMS